MILKDIKTLFAVFLKQFTTKEDIRMLMQFLTVVVAEYKRDSSKLLSLTSKLNYFNVF